MHWTRDRPSTVDSHELIVAHDEAGLYWSQGLDINSLNADAFLLVDGIKVV